MGRSWVRLKLRWDLPTFRYRSSFHRSLSRFRWSTGRCYTPPLKGSLWRGELQEMSEVALQESAKKNREVQCDPSRIGARANEWHRTSRHGCVHLQAVARTVGEKCVRLTYVSDHGVYGHRTVGREAILAYDGTTLFIALRFRDHDPALAFTFILTGALVRAFDIAGTLALTRIDPQAVDLLVARRRGSCFVRGCGRSNLCGGRAAAIRRLRGGRLFTSGDKQCRDG